MSEDYFWAEAAFNLEYLRKDSTAENPVAAFSIVRYTLPPNMAYQGAEYYGQAEYLRPEFISLQHGRIRKLYPPGYYVVTAQAYVEYRSRECSSRNSFSFLAKRTPFSDETPDCTTLLPHYRDDKLNLIGKASRTDQAFVMGFEYKDPTQYAPAVVVCYSPGFESGSSGIFGYNAGPALPGFSYEYRAFLELNETTVYGDWVSFTPPWPTPEIHVEDDQQLKLSVRTYAQHRYQLESTDDLTMQWLPVPLAAFDGDESTKSITVPISGPRRFYRYQITKSPAADAVRLAEGLADQHGP